MISLNASRQSTARQFVTTVHAVVVLLVLTSLSSRAVAQQPAVVQSFELRERFGVSHPEQIIDFDLKPDLKKPIDPQQCAMIGPDGKEVTFQILSKNRVAIRTDLPANAVKTWTLVARKPQPRKPEPSELTVQSQGSWHQITHDKAGVRIPNVTSTVTGTEGIPAPIQAIRYADGSWVGGAPVTLRQNPAVTAMSVKFEEQGPLLVQVCVEYIFDRPARKFEKLTIPQGAGYYRSTIRMQAGQPSIMILEDADSDLQYALNLYENLTPDQGRYRGHHSSTPARGHLPDGSPYVATHMRENMDAITELDCTKFYESGPVLRDTIFPRLAKWDPWAVDTGWYWMVYNSTAPASANLLGIFHGRPSLVLGPGDSGVGFHFGQPPKPAVKTPAPAVASNVSNVTIDKPQPNIGLTINFNRRDWGANVSPRIRFEWGLFLGTKGQDLKPHDQIQPIGVQQNLHAGISLNKLHRFDMDYPDAKNSFAGMFTDPSVFQKLHARLRAEPPKSGVKNFGSRIASEDELSRKWLELWADSTGVKSKEATATVLNTARTLLNLYVNGDGVYDKIGQYWKGGSAMNSAALTTAYLLSTDEVPPEDRAKLKAAMVMFGAVLWDMDFVPLFEGHNLNQGNLNMPPMQYAHQDSLAMVLRTHPQFAPYAANVGKRTIRTLDDLVRDSGAQAGSPHYASASMDTTISSLLRVKQLGGADPFATEVKITRFAEFYLNFLTPPEPRFGGLRKLVAFGDGCYESSTIHGKLGTGFRDANPQLAARLIGAWTSQGKPHSGFFGLPTRMQIDDDAPAADPALRSADYAGYYSVLRHGWASKDESALWIINGETYNDHRHGDHGSFVLYALGTPISLDWGSMYAPRAASAYVHSMAVPESHLLDAAGQPIIWSQDGPSLYEPEQVWYESRSTGFAALSNSASAGGSFKLRSLTPVPDPKKPSISTTWTRSVQSIHINPALPIYVVRDRFENAPGTLSDQPMIVSTNFLASGPVTLPSGPSFTPAPRMHPRKNDFIVKEQLPSAGPVMKLSPGVNMFGFTGQLDVDWDVAVVSTANQEALLGAWGHQSHPSTDANQFAKAMNMPFEERQYILRLRSSSPQCQVILPYRRGQRPEGLKVTSQGANVIVTSNDSVFTIGPSTWTLQSAHRQAAGTFDGTPVTIAGWSLAGAPAELTIHADQQITGTLAASAQGATLELRSDLLAGKTLTIDGQKPVRISGSTTPIRAQETPVQFSIR